MTRTGKSQPVDTGASTSVITSEITQKLPNAPKRLISESVEAAPDQQGRDLAAQDRAKANVDHLACLEESPAAEAAVPGPQDRELVEVVFQVSGLSDLRVRDR